MGKKWVPRLIGPAFSLLALCAESWTFPTTADAATFHGYGIAGIQGTSITAISTTRYDEVVYTPSGVNCTTPYAPSSNPAYQTEWINNEAGDWVELGTGHQCGGFQFWYAGYGSGDIWHSIWTQSITQEQKHRFWVQGTVSNRADVYSWNIDVTKEAGMALSFSAPYDQTGLESYSSATTAAAYTMTAMTEASSYSTTDYAWSGTSVVEKDAPLCVTVYSDTDVVSGENVGC